MNKLFRILAFVMPFFAVSCVEDLTGPDADRKETVTITLHSDAQTKTMLVDGKHVVWEEGDFVDINNVLYEVKIDENNPDIAYVENVTAADAYYAHYTGAWYYYVDGEVIFEIPARQNYREGSFGAFTNQMIAYGTSTDLYFYNAASVIRLGLKGDGESVKSVVLSSNNKEPMSGYYSVPFEDFENLEEFGGLQTDAVYVKRAYVQLNVDGAMQLGGEPQYVYVVVPPQTYSNGFTVTVTDTEGKVCHQSTEKSITTNRSEILRMADFTFNATESLAITEVVPGPAGVDYTITSLPNQRIGHAVVLKTLWDRFMTDYGEGYEMAAANALMNKCGLAYNMPAEGQAEFHGISTINYNDHELLLTSDTEYVLLASYAGTSSVGAVVTKEFKTLEGSGNEPAITADPTASDSEIVMNVRVSDDATGIIWYRDPKSVTDSLVDSGMTLVEIANLWGDLTYAESLDAAKSETGFTYTFSDLEQNTEYSVIFIVTTETGAQAVRRIDVRTADLFGVEGKWTLYSDAAAMDCGMLSCFSNFDYKFRLASLVVEKLGDHDIFRVVDLDRAINSHASAFAVTDKPNYFYIDARDPDAVRMPAGMNRMSMGTAADDMVYYSAADMVVGASFGSYDKSAGVLHLGTMAITYYGDGPYLVTQTSTLYLGDVPADTNGWGIVGELNNWGNPTEDGSVISDIRMEPDGSGQFVVARDVTFPDGYFKLRQYGQWFEGFGNVGLYQASGMLEANHVYDVVNSWYDACDMYVRAGKYDVWFDVANNRLYMMTAGRSMSDAVYGTPADIPQDDPASGYGIYVENRVGWNSMSVYVWWDGEDGVTYQTFGTWPGRYMYETRSVNGVEYFYTDIPMSVLGKTVGLIFNNSGNGLQSPDITAVLDRDVYFRVTSDGVDLIDPDKVEAWYLVGWFNEWVVRDENYRMTETEGYYVFKGLTISENQELGLKFNGGNWEINRGGVFMGVNTAFGVYHNGENIAVPAGTYDVYMTKAADMVYFMEPGKLPNESEGGFGNEDFFKDDVVEW